MTDEWALFLKENRFLVGVSVDGPEELHNRYRRDAKGIGSYAGAMNAVELFKRYGVPFNVLCTVNAANENRGREVYAFLRTLSDYLQFLPVVECLPTVYEKEEGHRFALPPGRYSPRIAHPVTDFSVSSKGYGRFLCDVLAAWRELGDPGRVQVQQINAALALKEGKPCGLCTHEAVCGHGAVIETDGDVFRCDRYVFPRYRLGNLLETGLQEMMEQNRDFGMHKTCSLPESCLTCPYVRLCFGGCPKDRFLADDQGRPGKNYLCEGYRQFFGCL